MIHKAPGTGSMVYKALDTGSRQDNEQVKTENRKQKIGRRWVQSPEGDWPTLDFFVPANTGIEFQHTIKVSMAVAHWMCRQTLFKLSYHAKLGQVDMPVQDAEGIPEEPKLFECSSP